ncbi:MAG: hypothetical protein R6U98_25910 [Pirellulaceae bacterium]
MERCPTQAVLPLVGLAAENVIRDRYMTGCKKRDGRQLAKRLRIFFANGADEFRLEV